MPTIRDMGIEAAFTPTPNAINDPSILLSALALRERMRAARIEHDQRERGMAENARQFDRAAAQRDREIQIDEGDLRMRRGEFRQRKKAIDVGMQDRAREIGQEAAAQGMFADLAEHMGMFPAPEVRARFEQLAPDDQQRAIGMFQQEQTEKKQAAQFQKLGSLLENAAANKLIDPTAAQVMLGQAEADPANMDVVYGQAQKLITDTAARNTDMQQRQAQAQTLAQILPTLNVPPARQAAYGSMLLTDPDASYTSILKMALEEQEQAEADRMAGEQMRMQMQQNARDLLTLHPGATPETAGAAARLRANDVPIGVGEANFTGETRQTINEADEKILSTLEKRVASAQSALNSATTDKKRKEAQAALGKANALYEREFERVTGRPMPGGASEQEAEYEDAFNRAMESLAARGVKKPTRNQIKAEMQKLVGE